MREALCPHDGFQTVVLREVASDKADPYIGKLFEGRFQILELLGRGGFGAVYRAVQLGIQRDVAIKILDAGIGGELNEIARFQQEARALAQLKHPHIVDVYDFGQSDDGALYMTMEYLHGRTLEAHLAEGATLSVDELVDLAAGVLDALAGAHERRIVHRDLKPANIFLAEATRGRIQVKLLDFGIARMATESGHTSSLTRTGAILGSPPYMSPEQCSGERVGASSDLYSLGCVLYEALTGRRVFEHKTSTACLVAHCTETPDRPSRDGVALEGPLVELIMGLLEKHPDDRPASAEAALEQLEALRAAPLDTPLPAPSVRPLKFVASSTSRSSAPAPVVHGPAVGLQTQRAGPGVAPRARGSRWLVPVVGLVVVAGIAGAIVALSGGSGPERAAAVVTGPAVAKTEPAPVSPPAPEPAVAKAEAEPGAATKKPEPAPEPAPAIVAPTPEPAPEPTLEPGPAVVAKADAPAPIEPVAASKVTRVVTLDAQPVATVKRGDEELGTTPVEVRWVEGDAAPVLSLSAQGHVPLEVTLGADDVAAGRRVVQLKRRPRPATSATPVDGPTW